MINEGVIIRARERWSIKTSLLYLAIIDKWMSDVSLEGVIKGDYCIFVQVLCWVQDGKKCAVLCFVY